MVNPHLLLASVLACATSDPASVPVVESVEDATAHVGQQVRFRGTLQNAKAGPLVQGKQLSIYCIGPTFDPSRFRSPINVAGRLVQPQPEPTTPGEVQQQAVGPDWYLMDCAEVPSK